jgi:hypothetical protein
MSQSRLEKMLDSSLLERRYPESSYRVRSAKDKPFGFKRHEKPRTLEELSLVIPASKPLASPKEQEWRAIEEEIKLANFILDIQNDEESDDFVPYEKATLSRATAFLRRLMIHSHAANVVGMGVPQIGPADRGSIDLYWEKTDRTLLINFLASENTANFYGKKPKSEISGRFDPSEARAELVFWLAD